MTSKRVVFLIFGAALLALLYWYLWGPTTTPAGQPALVTLSNNNFAAFESAFDDAADVPRLLVLLSPT